MQELMEQINTRHESMMGWAREWSKKKVDKNNISEIKQVMNAIRVRLEARDFKDAIEESCLKARANALYDKCRELEPEQVEAYERYIRKDIARGVKKNAKAERRRFR